MASDQPVKKVPVVSATVVIASKVGEPFVDECLESIKAEVEALGAEAIVVASGSEQNAARIAHKFPWARVIQVPSTYGVPASRRRGVEEARGEIIAVIEERCLASEGWLQRAVDAMSAGNYGAAGGPIADSDFKRLRDWVVYFCEYNDSIPPVIEGDTYQLNGANAVYRRELLLDHADLLSDGDWEATLHPALVAEGVKFLSVAEMAVRKRGPFSYGYYLRQRYLFSRAFAGARAENMSALKRAVYLLATPLVPGLVLFRIGSRLWAKRYRLGRFAMALPLILPALIVLAVGETVGYLLGPGDALSKVE